MLKLQKSSHSSHIEVRLREREGFFNSSLLKALALALSLHIGAFLLFHIQPFHLTTSFLFPPVHVQMEAAPLLSSPLLLQAEGKEEAHLPSPPLLVPCDPLLLCTQLDWQQLSLPSDFKHNPFNSLEQLHYPLLSLSPPRLKKPFLSLFISGELATYTLTQEDPRLREEIEVNNCDPLYVSYQVRVAQGMIFWHERTQASGKSDVDDLTEEALLYLRFETGDKLLPLTGEAHFVVYEPA